MQISSDDDELAVAQSFFHLQHANAIFVVSLGSSCITAHNLAQLGLRKFAGPFDWIFSSPRMVSHMVMDNFITFLDKSQITTSAKYKFKAGHRFYSKMLQGTGYCRPESKLSNVIFNHHDPSIDEGHAYFQRTVRRFRHCLSCANPKLFVICSLEYRDQIDDKDLERLFTTLCEICRGSFELVVVKVFAQLPPAVKATRNAAEKRTPPSSGCTSTELQHLRMTANGCCDMRVYELHCPGERPLDGDGLTLTDEHAREELKRIVLSETYGEHRLATESIAPDPLKRVGDGNHNERSNSFNKLRSRRFCKAKHL